jgi:nicotinate-nucleotide adenylyltransferase
LWTFVAVLQAFNINHFLSLFVSGMNLGIFGGAFNPPHIGHLVAAESVREQLRLDKVIFVPSADPPHRTDVGRATAKARLEMTRLAIQGNTTFEVSDIEVVRPGKSYTIDTITAFHALYPKVKLCLLIGSDNLAEFHTWKSPREIITMCDLIVFPRPGFSVSDVKNEFTKAAEVVNVPHVGISASEIRRKVRMGKSIRYLVTRGVAEYILKNGLYRD